MEIYNPHKTGSIPVLEIHKKIKTETSDIKITALESGM